MSDAPRRNRDDHGPMTAALRFLFGTGFWSAAWHLFHFLLLLPPWGFYVYFRDFVPGAGPQGGEAILAMMILYVLVLVGVAAINGLVLMIGSGGRWWQRFLLWPGLVLLATIVAVVLGFFTGGLYFEETLNLRGRIALPVFALLTLVLFYGANFWALAKASRR